MSLSAGHAKLRDALKQLRLAMLRAQSDWDDRVRREFEEEHIRPLDTHVLSAMNALGRLSDAVSKARRECRGEDQVL